MKSIDDYLRPTFKQGLVIPYIGKGYIIFWGGAKGGGKSVGCSYYAILACLLYPGLQVTIVRETWSQLLKNFFLPMKILYPPNEFNYKALKGDRMFEFANGSAIYFQYCSRLEDAESNRGVQSQLLIIDEANFRDTRTLLTLMSNVRRSKSRLPNFIPTIIMTGNAGGECDEWFIDHFVEPDYSKWTEGELSIRDKYLYIPASVDDNEHISEEYIALLESLPEDMREALRNGNWFVKWGTFFSEWRDDKHVVEPFTIPQHWPRAFGFDLGYTSGHKSVGLWFAQNPDTDELFLYREYSGTVTEQCIKDIIRLSEGEYYRARVCDPSIFVERKDTYTAQSVGEMFMRAGFGLQPANNKRKQGWALLRQWLYWNDNHPPLFKVFSTCYGTIDAFHKARHKVLGDIADIGDLKDFNGDDPLDVARYVVCSAGFQYPLRDLRGNPIASARKVEVPANVVLRTAEDLPFRSRYTFGPKRKFKERL